ncbi:MAG: ATP-binding cassette domain-containing protein [Saprospiraceae bacterium]|nr:ATP-binding cassette domain-containing protein [Saprospiraceae bacterium]
MTGRFKNISNRHPGNGHFKRHHLRGEAGRVGSFARPKWQWKSTFLTILAGLQPPTSGKVWLFGRELQSYSVKELQQLRAAHIGFIFQTFNLMDALNGLENILLVMKFTGTPGKIRPYPCVGLDGKIWHCSSCLFLSKNHESR